MVVYIPCYDRCKWDVEKIDTDSNRFRMITWKGGARIEWCGTMYMMDNLYRTADEAWRWIYKDYSVIKNRVIL